jgi:hypothetical protein
METGFCRYGGKCQFAHGTEELRQVKRHPKYKTRYCRNFMKVLLHFEQEGCWYNDIYLCRREIAHMVLAVDLFIVDVVHLMV